MLILILLILAGYCGWTILVSSYEHKLQYGVVILVCLLMVPLYIGLFILIAYSGYILLRRI